MSLILGKPVKDKPDLRYVRLPDQDAVYVVAVKTDKISAKFGDWIEKDLLKMNSWDMKNVFIHDYSVDVLAGTDSAKRRLVAFLRRRGRSEVEAAEGRAVSRQSGTPGKLAADEELNTARLDEMKTALDDLKIVNVARKPQGLSNDLKAAANFLSNREAVESLADCGFFAAAVEGPQGILLQRGRNSFLNERRRRVRPPLRREGPGDGSGEEGGEAAGLRRREPLSVRHGGIQPRRPSPNPPSKPFPRGDEGPRRDKKPADKKSAAKKEEKKDPPTLPPSGNGSKRRTSGSKRNTKRSWPRARSESRSSTPASPIGTTSSPTTFTARSTSPGSRSSRRRRRRPPGPRTPPASPPTITSTATTTTITTRPPRRRAGRSATWTS